MPFFNRNFFLLWQGRLVRIHALTLFQTQTPLAIAALDRPDLAGRTYGVAFLCFMLGHRR